MIPMLYHSFHISSMENNFTKKSYFFFLMNNPLLITIANLLQNFERRSQAGLGSSCCKAYSTGTEYSLR